MTKSEESRTPEALERLREEAASGVADAQHRVGMMFAFPGEEAQNNGEARKWFRRAAEQGHADAQFNLGNLFHSASLAHRALEIGEARIEAYVWFYLAAAQGHRQAAASCEMLNLTMTDAELREGNRRASAFQVRKENSRP